MKEDEVEAIHERAIGTVTGTAIVSKTVATAVTHSTTANVNAAPNPRGATAAGLALGKDGTGVAQG